MKISFFGSSLLSAYWNGAATYYRGILSALFERGHEIVFYEPDAWDRQRHRDLCDPPYARAVVYPANDDATVIEMVKKAAREADLLVKASGVGVFDALLEEAVLELRRAGAIVAFWDVDAAATLERVSQDASDPFRSLIPLYDVVFTYGGGDSVVQSYGRLGAQRCFPIYNALDPATTTPRRPMRTLMARSAFSAIACLIARRGCLNSFSHRPERIRACASSLAAVVGRMRCRPIPISPTLATSIPRLTTRSIQRPWPF